VFVGWGAKSVEIAAFELSVDKLSPLLVRGNVELSQ
jgi:hypothetical protein